MVRNVSGCDVGERPHREGFSTGDSTAHPRVCGKIPEEAQRGPADCTELVDVARPGELIGLCGGDRNILLEARKGSVEFPREPQSAEDEHSLGVVHVVQRLADAPLVRRVAAERFLLGDAAQESYRFVPTVFQEA